jgi:hypothetical protein
MGVPLADVTGALLDDDALEFDELELDELELDELEPQAATATMHAVAMTNATRRRFLTVLPLLWPFMKCSPPT